MSSKALTYFFGFNYREYTPLSLTGTTLEVIAEELKLFLLPDKVQFRKRIKSVVFVHQTAARHDIFRPIQFYPVDIYYVYQVESIVFESDLSQLVTSYQIDMPVQIFSFMSGLSLLCLCSLFMFQKITGIQNGFYSFVEDLYIVIPFLVIIKSLVAHSIHTDIEAYREKLRRV